MELTRDNMDKAMYRLAKLAAKPDEKEARNPKGKPISPEKMEQQAPGWKGNIDEHKDKFKKNKSAADKCKKCGEVLNSDDKRWAKKSGLCRECAMEEAMASGKLKLPLKKADFEAAEERLALLADVEGVPAVAGDEDGDDEKESRFEEGKPADPCQNMTEAECAKWKKHEGEIGKKGSYRQRLTWKQAARGIELWAAVYGDGVLAGATDDPTGGSPRFWGKTASRDGFAVYKLANVPLELAEKLIDHGTRAQQFADGYQAWNAAKRYASNVPAVHMAGDLVHKWGRAMVAGKPGGLYGYTKRVQSDCETAGRKLARAAGKLARTAYKKDERVAPFLATHAGRSKSTAAKILVAAMKDIGPKVAAQMEKRAGYGHRPTNLDPDQERLWDALHLIAENDGNAYRKGDAAGAVLTAWREYSSSKAADMRADFRAIKKALIADLAADWAETRMASKTAGYSMYGYRTKTATLGLNACAALKTEAGRIASDLHRRRADKHANITGFLTEHSKKARCMYSKMLCAGYPDAEMRLASVEEPKGVESWLTWED